jgi:hypothetical protein
MKPMPYNRRSILLAAVVLSVAGCAKDDTSGPDIGSIRVRFVHAIADTGALDVRFNARLSVGTTAVPYGAASEYETVTGTQVNTSAQVSPSIDLDKPRPLANLTRISIASGGTLTLVAAGEARDSVSGRAAGITGYIDDLSAPASGQARLRVINASPDAGAIDVYATIVGGVQGPVPTVPGIDYRSQVSRTLAAGSYVLTITRLSDPANVLATSSVVLPAGGVQTAVIRGYAGVLPPGLATSRRLAATIIVDRAP